METSFHCKVTVSRGAKRLVKLLNRKHSWHLSIRDFGVRSESVKYKIQSHHNALQLPQ